MAIEHSRNLLGKIGDGASSETFTAIGAQANGRLGLSGERIDVSNKTNTTWRQAIAGLREFVWDGDGYVDWPDTSGFEALRTNATALTAFNCEIQLNSSANKYAATVQATRLEIDAPDNNATQWRTTWELSTGAPTYT